MPKLEIYLKYQTLQLTVRSILRQPSMTTECISGGEMGSPLEEKNSEGAARKPAWNRRLADSYASRWGRAAHRKNLTVCVWLARDIYGKETGVDSV